MIKGFPVPEFVLGSLKTIGMTVIPLALFSVGVNLRFSKVKDRLRDVSAVILIKMVIAPAVFILILLFAGVSIDTPYLSAVIEVSMPPMVLASILVIGAGLDRDLAVSSVGTGIIFSFLSVPALFFMVRLLTA
ncbi:MAG: AEC family transporter [Persephonella sp.]|nr:AEC family transporter [Persephonella sp.]